MIILEDLGARPWPVIRALHATFSNSDIKAAETTEGVGDWPSTSVLLISRNLFIKHVSSTGVCTRTTHSGTPHLHFRHRVYLYRPCIYRPVREAKSRVHLKTISLKNTPKVSFFTHGGKIFWQTNSARLMAANMLFYCVLLASKNLTSSQNYPM